MWFVSNCLKAFKLQMVVQAPMSAMATSNYNLGTLDFLSTCLGIDSLIAPFSFRRIMLPRERDVIFIP